MKNFSRHKGISLFELLIVIAVIVILSTAMFLSSLDSAGTADAAKIIADLTTIRKAAIAWYADNRETFRQNTKNVNNQTAIISDISQYIGSGTSITLNNSSGGINSGCYGISNVNGKYRVWYVGYKFTTDEGELKNKLAGRANSLGLHFTKSDRPDPLGQAKESGNDYVWMHVLGTL